MFAPEDPDLAGRLLGDTWEHSESGTTLGRGGVTLQSLTVNSSQIGPGQEVTGIITLTGPAPTGGVAMQLTLTPLTNALQFNPLPSLVIPEHNTGISFGIVAEFAGFNESGVAGTYTVQATVGTISKQAQLIVPG